MIACIDRDTKDELGSPDIRKLKNYHFDINHNRVTPYSPGSEGEKKRIANITSININDLLKKGKLYNPIEDHLKNRKPFLDFLFHISPVTAVIML